MPANNVYFFRPVAAVFLFLALGSSANAKLKDTPPKDVSPDGGWQIDVDASDDPAAAMDSASGSIDSGGSRRGGMRGMRGGGSSGGMGGRRGRSRQESPTGGDDESDSSAKTNRDTRQTLLRQMAQNPATLTVSTKGHALRVATDTTASDCEAGEKVSVIDSNGTGERHCGWDGRAWLVETAYAHSFTRSDRYEFSKDGKQLNYTTKVSGRVSMKLNRVYIKSIPAAASPT